MLFAHDHLFPVPLFLLQSDCRFWIAVSDKIPLSVYYKKPTVMKTKKEDGFQNSMLLLKNGLRKNVNARESELRNAPENRNKFILLIKKKRPFMSMWQVSDGVKRTLFWSCWDRFHCITVSLIANFNFMAIVKLGFIGCFTRRYLLMVIRVSMPRLL